MQDDGKYASKTYAKPTGVLCTVLPIVLTLKIMQRFLCSFLIDYKYKYITAFFPNTEKQKERIIL